MKGYSHTHSSKGRQNSCLWPSHRVQPRLSLPSHQIARHSTCRLPLSSVAGVHLEPLWTTKGSPRLPTLNWELKPVVRKYHSYLERFANKRNLGPHGTMAMKETGEILNPWNGESELGPFQPLAKILEGVHEMKEKKSLLEKRTIKGKLSLTGLIVG